MPVNIRVAKKRLAQLGAGGVQFRKRRETAAEITQQQLEEIARQEGPGVLLGLAEKLSIPGDLFRGVVTGQPGTRVTARELLDKLGIEPKAEFSLAEPTFAGTAAGVGVLATDILTDPLSLLVGVGQLGKGAKALRGAQQAVRRGRTFRRAGREVVENIRDLPRALRPTARKLGSRARATPEELLAAGGIKKAPRELLGKARELQRQEFAKARKLFAEAERRGTVRPGAGGTLTERIRGLVSERPAGIAALPFGAKAAELSVREGFRVGKTAPGARELLQVGIPFTRFRGRVPVPKILEKLVGGTAASVTAPLGFGLQKIFGRGGFVTPELRQAERFFARQADSVKGLQSEKIAARAEELVAQRIIEKGGGPEDLFAAVHEQFNTDIRGVRESSMSARNLAEQEFADSLSGMVDARTFAQYARGARDAGLIDEYAERILSAAGRKAIRDQGKMDLYKEFIRGQFDRHIDAGVREGSQIGRRDYLPELTNDANQWFRDNGIVAGEDFFSLDAAQTVSETIRQRSLSTLHANLAGSFVDDVAGIPGRAGDLLLSRFLQRLGLKGYRGARWSAGTDAKGIAKALDDAAIRDVSLPFEAAQEFESVFGANFGKIGNKQIDSFLSKVYDPIASIFRVGVTAPFPAFHIRNFMSNTILNFMGGVRDIGSYKKAFDTYITTNKALAAKAGRPFDQALRDELVELGVLQGGQMQRILDEAIERSGAGVAGEVPESVFQAALAWTRNTGIAKAGFNAGSFVEDTNRLAHFFSKKKQGLTDLDAVNSVNKFLFDYSNKALNGLERTYLNRLMFFYRWNRFAAPLVLRTLFEHPNRAAVVLKATVQPGIERPAGLPEFLRESAAIPAGVDPETGETSFISRLGSPFEVLEFIDPSGAKQPGFFGGLQKLSREVAQQFIPPVRFLFEQMAGEEFFMGREIQDLDKVPALQALFGELLGAPFIGEVVPRSPGAGGGVRFRGDPEFRFGLRQLPTTRITSTFSRAFEQLSTAALRGLGKIPEGAAIRGQRSIPQEILRTLAGVQITEIDTKEETKRQAQRRVKKLLDDLRISGDVARIPIFTTTQKGKQKPEARELLKLLNKINRAGRAAPRRNVLAGVPGARGQ